MKFSLAIAVLFGGVLGLPLTAQAQSLPTLPVSSGATMQDMENEALRNAVTRATTGSDAASSGASSYGNVFQASQTGQYNTIDAVQTGTNNLIQIVQVGQMNTAVVAQSGSNNRITLRQGR